MPLALFDLDNTLIAGDSDHSWGQFLVENGYVDATHYRRNNDKYYRDYVAGTLDNDAYLKFSLAPLAEMPMQQLADMHAVFMDQYIIPMHLTKADELLQKHRAQNDRIVVITSTNRFVVEPICHALGLTEILATELVIKNGRYSGDVDGVATFREGKVTRLTAWLKQHRETLEGSYFYTDSINDLALLECVDQPIVVDPDPALLSEAEKRNWQVISLRQ
jgi:HAD superfamily hydrolase (TIGR01490 family)